MLPRLMLLSRHALLSQHVKISIALMAQLLLHLSIQEEEGEEEDLVLLSNFLRHRQRLLVIFRLAQLSIHSLQDVKGPTQFVFQCLEPNAINLIM